MFQEPSRRKEGMKLKERTEKDEWTVQSPEHLDPGQLVCAYPL